MSKDLIADLIDFLNDANLSSYEIHSFIAIIEASKRESLTAREISTKSNVPIGRIYEVLEDLCSKGMIEILESRPRKFKSLPLNEALFNLINYQTNENKRKVEYLHDRVKLFESDLYINDSHILKTPNRLFWSTTFGTQSIYLAYIKYINDAKDEMLFNDFVNENTLKILAHGRLIFEPIRQAVERGVKVKRLLNFQIDKRFLNNEIKHENSEIFKKIVKIYEEKYKLFPNMPSFEVKYIHQKIPTLYDIFDKKRIIFKLQNPLKPTQIFATMNVVDPNLVEKLRENYLHVWTLESIGINSE